jgi:DNA invertase Pin-like site-specific DNA recombinase
MLLRVRSRLPGRRRARLLSELDDGVAVVVTRLDRLARSTLDLLKTLAAIGGANATFRSLHDGWGG